MASGKGYMGIDFVDFAESVVGKAVSEDGGGA